MLLRGVHPAKTYRLLAKELVYPVNAQGCFTKESVSSKN
jgi:hypothetical protein